jgi:hypothetical protein
MTTFDKFSSFTTEANNAVYFLKQTWVEEGAPDGFSLKLILLDGTNCWTGNCNKFILK